WHARRAESHLPQEIVRSEPERGAGLRRGARVGRSQAGRVLGRRAKRRGVLPGRPGIQTADAEQLVAAGATRQRAVGGSGWQLLVGGSARVAPVQASAGRRGGGRSASLDK